MNTTLELSEFVSIPCALQKVEAKADVKLDRATVEGHAIRRIDVDKTLIDAGVPLEEQTALRSDEIVHGRWEGEEFHPIPKDALQAIKDETKLETAKIDGYVPLKDVPFERSTGCYYIRPQRGGPTKPLAMLHKALAKKKVAGIVKFTPRERQVLGVVYAKNGALLVNTLAFAADFRRQRDAAEALAGIDASAEGVKLAEQLIEQKTLDATAIDGYEDEAVEKKAELVELALAGKAIKTGKKKKSEATKPDALMEALRASVAAGKSAAPRQKVPA